MPTGRTNQPGPVLQRVLSQRREELRRMLWQYTHGEIVVALKQLAVDDPDLPPNIRKLIEAM